MIKKSVDKKTVSNEAPKKRTYKKKVVKERENKDVEDILVDNFVSLQRVMVNLSVKFDSLTNQISKLLELFEVSAKVLAEKDFDVEKNARENTKIIEKLDSILEQNKTLARGLTLMHDKINETPNYPPQQQAPRFQQQAPSFRPAQKTSMMGGASEEYHKPISSNG